MDNVNFPNNGYLAQIGTLSSLKALGSTDEYYKVQGSVIGAYTFRKQTVLASFAAGSHIGNQLPFYDQFRLGGFLNLSGLRSNQILGQSMALGKIITYHKVGQSFIGDLYLGGSWSYLARVKVETSRQGAINPFIETIMKQLEKSELL